MTNSAEGVDRGRVWRRTLSHSLRLDNVRYFGSGQPSVPVRPESWSKAGDCLQSLSTCSVRRRIDAQSERPADRGQIQSRLLLPSVECLLHGLKIALAARSLGEHAKPLTQRVGASEAHLAAHAVTLRIDASDPRFLLIPARQKLSGPGCSQCPSNSVLLTTPPLCSSDDETPRVPRSCQLSWSFPQ